MAQENQKQIDFITRARQLATQYKDIITELQKLSGEWSSLYSTIVTEVDFEDNANRAIIPSGTPATRLTSLTDAIGNFNTIISSYDAGIDTNLERIDS